MVNTTIQINDKLRDQLKLECLHKKIDYEKLIEDMFYVFKKNIPFKNELAFRKWFEKNYEWFGYTKIIENNLKKKTPDYIMLKEDGKKEKVELEIIDKHFIEHKHNPKEVDKIICVYGVKKEIKGVPILSLVMGYPENEYSSISLKKETIKKLAKYKIHKNQAMEEVVKKLLEEKDG